MACEHLAEEERRDSIVETGDAGEFSLVRVVEKEDRIDATVLVEGGRERAESDGVQERFDVEEHTRAAALVIVAQVHLRARRRPHNSGESEALPRTRAD